MESEDEFEHKYKIGITKHKNINKRKLQLKTGNPNNINILYFYESEYNTKIESTLHKLYSSKRLDGEWFKLNISDIKNFVSNCKKIEDNIIFLEKNNNPFII